MIFYILTAAGGFIVGATFGVVITAFACACKMAEDEYSRISGEWEELKNEPAAAAEFHKNGQ